MTNWHEWHKPYEDPSSDLIRRRRAIQRMFRTALDERPGEETTIISLCAGDGRDIMFSPAEEQWRSAPW
jgi:hypothetical protein